MSKRPTIADLAEAAGVSRATVNRVIQDASKVRPATRERVLDCARRIGFYGLGSLEHALKSAQRSHRLGVLLLQKHRLFYQTLAKALEDEAGAYARGTIELDIRFLEDLSPESVAENMLKLSETNEAIAIVAAEHPLVTDAVVTLSERGVPVWTLLSPISSPHCRGHIGLDAWKVGRMAAWAMDKISRGPGEVGLFVGNHRFRNQELNEIGFRSYLREHAPNLIPLEAQSTYESADAARELTLTLLKEHPNLQGLFVAGGGITGVLAAFQEMPNRPNFVTVGYDLIGPTRSALINGDLTLVISHPLSALSREAIKAMAGSTSVAPTAGTQSIVLNFETFTQANV